MVADKTAIVRTRRKKCSLCEPACLLSRAQAATRRRDGSCDPDPGHRDASVQQRPVLLGTQVTHDTLHEVTWASEGDGILLHGGIIVARPPAHAPAPHRGLNAQGAFHLSRIPAKRRKSMGLRIDLRLFCRNPSRCRRW